MNKKVYEGKDLETIISNIKEDLNITEKDFYYHIIEDESSGVLFLKKKKIKAEIYLIEDIKNHVKEYLTEILKNMGFDAQIEVLTKHNKLIFNINSENNGLLIGKNGKNVKALQTFITKYLANNYRINIPIVIDVNEYRKKTVEKLQNLARKLARSVVKTKVPVKLDPMNSYERRIIHTSLANDNYVKTESEGEEPNRYVVIKLKK